MNNIDRRFLLGAAGLAGAAAISKLAHAGPVAPPPGPVAPTGVTLDQLAARTAATPQGVAEPRIPVSLQTTPPASPLAVYSITAPGSYYLTGDINAAAAGGNSVIEILAAGVTLDLCGFTIRSTVLNVGIAISVQGSATIRNGAIWDYETGVSGSDLVTEDLRLACSSRGLDLGNRSVARRCTSIGAGNAGIRAGSFGVISDCSVSGPSARGIDVAAGCVVERCIVSNCGAGIWASGNNNRVVACTVNSSAGLGIRSGTHGLVQDCYVNATLAGAGGVGDGIIANAGAAVVGCSAVGNAAAGILAVGGNAVERCHVASNGVAGVAAAANSRIGRCTVTGHTAAGSAAVRLSGTNCVVEDNHFANNALAVDAVNVVNNLIVRNMALGNTNFIAVNVGGNWYPSIPLSGVNTATNPLNNVVG